MKWTGLLLLWIGLGSASLCLANGVIVHTGVTTIAAETSLTQNAYRWYANLDGLDPVSPAASENASVEVPDAGTQVRLRMNIEDGGLALAPGANFFLQYANASSGPWTDVGTSTPWAFFDNPSVADGQIIINTLLAQSTVGESYGESNPSAATPNQLLPGDYGEWDWSLVNNSAATSSDWFFRMADASDTGLEGYVNFPEFTAVPPSPPPPPPNPSSTPPIVTTGGGGGGTSYVTSSTLPASPPLLSPEFQVADFNGDNKVDIIDLSILLYYYGRCGLDVTRYDLNQDGCVDFPDVSILMYYWTG